MTLEEAKKLTCDECPHWLYKGDDEQYCKACGFRCFSRHRNQRKPGWCPMFKRAKYEAKANEKAGNIA